MRVWALIVNWNGGDEVLQAIESLRASRGVDLRVMVIDNGSVDGSDRKIEERWPDVEIDRTGRNLGFAAAVNRGLRRALEEDACGFVFLLNADACVDNDAVARLLAATDRHSRGGLFGGKIRSSEDPERLWCCGVRLGGAPNLARLRGHGEKDRGQYDREEVVSSLTGCGLLITRAVIDRIGLLDEAYFVYVEDADYCARARDAGFDCVYVPDARLDHRGGGATGGGYSAGRKYLTAHGSIRFLRDHGTAWLWAGFLVIDLLGWPLLFCLGLATGRLSGVLAKGRGLRDGLLGRPADRRVVGEAEMPEAPAS